MSRVGWALVFGAFVAVLFCFLGIALLFSQQLSAIEKMQIQAIDNFQSMRDEANAIQAVLSKEFEPVCGEGNLYRLRKFIFFSANVRDVGIRDEKGRLACSTSLGILAIPMVVPEPDATYTSPNTGLETNINLSIPIPTFDGQKRVTTVISAGKFSVVIHPLKTADLLLAGASAVQFAIQGFPVKTLVRSKLMPPIWDERLRTNSFLEPRSAQFDFRTMAFIEVSRPAESGFVIQTVVTTEEFLSKYRVELTAILMVALLIGSLCYLVARQVFEKRSGMEYRINSLLVAENILCQYQPIVDLHSGTAIGFEVLFRLRDGQKVLSPAAVLPAIIEKKLTWTLDQLVVQTALSEVTKRLNDFRGHKVAFNFFPESINHRRITSLFSDCLKLVPDHDLQFEIEVIEEAYAPSVAQEAALLRKGGFLISVDDFGTGYSNLAAVKTLSPDFLKIDRSFVMEMEEYSLRSNLIDEIVSIAKAVGAKVIAEGIENELQASLLRDKRVQFGQGYWFAKPMPIDQLSTFVMSDILEKLFGQSSRNRNVQAVSADHGIRYSV